jgi:hypothetical protein
MKYMRTIFVDENACVVIMVVGVAANVRPPITEQDFFIRSVGQPFGKDAPREAGAYD